MKSDNASPRGLEVRLILPIVYQDSIDRIKELSILDIINIWENFESFRENPVMFYPKSNLEVLPDRTNCRLYYKDDNKLDLFFPENQNIIICDITLSIKDLEDRNVIEDKVNEGFSLIKENLEPSRLERELRSREMAIKNRFKD